MKLDELQVEEAFDSSVAGVMKPTAWGWQGHFRWGESVFVVELRKRAVHGLSRKDRTYEASFFLKDAEGDDAFSTADTDENPRSSEVPVKVYGVVLNALLDVWETGPIDAMYFTAEPRHATDSAQHERKKQLYAVLSRRALRQGGGYLYVHHGAFSEWLLSKQPVDDAHWTNALREDQAVGSIESI